MRRRLTALLIAVCLTFLFQGVSAQSTPADPRTEAGTHPRLFFHAEDLGRLRELAQTSHRELWEPIRQFVDDELPRMTLPESAPISDDLNVYRGYADALIPLAFTCVIDEQEDDCDTARRYLMTITAWDRWDRGTERDLGFGHTLFASALAYDWLYNGFNASERAELARRISQRAQAMYDASTQRYNAEWNNWWANSFLQNHYWINNAALGMAALTLMDEPISLDCVVRPDQRVNLRAEPTTDAAIVRTANSGESFPVLGQTIGDDNFVWWQIGDSLWVRGDVVTETGSCDAASGSQQPMRWLERAVSVYERVNQFLEGIGDGTWHEGIFYQDYGLTMGIPFLLNLRRLTGTDLIPHGYFSQYVQWRLYNLLPGTKEYLMAYGDLEWWWDDVRATGVLRFIASEYDDSSAAWIAEQILNSSQRAADIYKAPWYVFEYLYYDAELAPTAPPASQILARTFPDLEGVIWRTGWGEDAIIFGLKTGAYGGRFSYDTFVNQLTPWDIPCSQTGCGLNAGHDHDDANNFYLYGGGEWLIPEVQGENNRATSFHNTLLIDGQGQQSPRGERPDDFIGTDGLVLGSANTPHFDYLAADATRRYSTIADLTSNIRYVMFVRPGYLIMVDEVRAAEPHAYTWASHFGERVTFDGDWLRGVSGSQLVGIQAVSPADVVTETGNDGRPVAHVAPAQAAERTTFIHLLVPTTSRAWDERPTAALIAISETAVYVRVSYHDGSERADDILLNIAPERSGLAARIGTYYFDGTAAVIRRSGDGSIDSLFLNGGTLLATFEPGEDAGRLLVAEADPSTPLEAVLSGIRADVASNASQPFLLYAPQAEQVYVNGFTHPLEHIGDYIVVPAGAES